jgi:peptidoglycan/LPS O-acetylase OafA/YrhL
LRIFPLYYGALALVFVVYPLVASPSGAFREIAGRQGWLWLYSSNVRIYLTEKWGFFEGECHLNHFWSLAVEEHFYLVWPLAVFLLGRRPLMALCGACAVTAVAWRALLVQGGHSFLCAYTFTPCRMDALAIGAFLALAARGPAGLAGMRTPALALGALCGVTLLGLFFVRGGLLIEDPWMQTGGYTLLAAFFAAVLVVTVTASPSGLVGWFGHSALLRFFGKYSYGLYVWHGLALPFLQGYLTPRMTDLLGSPFLVVVVQTAVSIAITLAVALLSWHLYEKQFLKLKRFFEYRRAESPDSSREPLLAGSGSGRVE